MVADDPRAFGHRKLAHLLRAECGRACRVDDAGGHVTLRAAMGRAEAERRLLEG